MPRSNPYAISLSSAEEAERRGRVAKYYGSTRSIYAASAKAMH